MAVSFEELARRAEQAAARSQEAFQNVRPDTIEATPPYSRIDPPPEASPSGIAIEGKHRRLSAHADFFAFVDGSVTEPQRIDSDDEYGEQLNDQLLNAFGTVKTEEQEAVKEEDQELDELTPDTSDAVAHQPRVVSPPERVRPTNYGGLRHTEHWREQAGRYGNRGGRSNPNVAWHTAKAKAQRQGKLEEFYRTHPKPPRQSR